MSTDTTTLILPFKDRNSGCDVYAHTFSLLDLFKGEPIIPGELFPFTMMVGLANPDGTFTDTNVVRRGWISGVREPMPLCVLPRDRIQFSRGSDIHRTHMAFYVVDPAAELLWKKGEPPVMETRVELTIHLKTNYVDVRISGPMEYVKDHTGQRVLRELTFGIRRDNGAIITPKD